jgi:hypothetical protein
MQLIKDYVKENYCLLFHHQPNNTLISIFDSKGFSFTKDAQTIYNLIKNQPHLYVAWTNNKNGNYYVGKSFQLGGRWKRQHAYHLGTLAHHLLDTTRYDDQNHAHWIEHWMNRKTQVQIENDLFSIELKEEVYISFIPFSFYSNQGFNTLEKKEIRQINTNIERQLIQSYRNENIFLLNVQLNCKTRP